MKWFFFNVLHIANSAVVAFSLSVCTESLGSAAVLPCLSSYCTEELRKRELYCSMLAWETKKPTCKHNMMPVRTHVRSRNAVLVLLGYNDLATALCFPEDD